MKIKSRVNKLRPMFYGFIVAIATVIVFANSAQASKNWSCSSLCRSEAKYFENQCLSTGGSKQECLQVKRDIYDKCILEEWCIAF